MPIKHSVMTTVFSASTDGWLRWGLGESAVQVPCVLGRSGVIAAADKREGDGCSPLGIWPIRAVLWRSDRGPKPETAFEVSPIGQNDGWCDAVGDPNYNRPVQHPYPASAEHLWREDAAYDIIVILGHNDDPVVDGMGSAIFMHCFKPATTPTAGCVALSDADLRRLLAVAKPGDAVAIIQAGATGA
jgi:L,D-peptidoglycan transpeptidase YkuD (ErfK/YbiS/YcfS/YnhG family)